MERIAVFLIRNDVWIYIISALGLFWYVTDLWRANRLSGQAVYSLERERATRMRNNALIGATLFTGVIAVVLFVNLRIAPTIPAELLKPPTPTPNIFSTPLSSPPPRATAVNQIFVTPNLAPTVTLVGEAGAAVDPEDEILQTPTATPFVPPTPFVDCTADLNISEPRDGAAVTGALSFFGTADTENFGYYLLETNGPQTNGEWASLLGRSIDQPTREGFLGNSNLTMWQPGPYLIRLTAVDISENITGQCVIQVTLVDSS